jgi:ferredoxin
LISAGIGATPVVAMLHALAQEHSEREIWWLHGARSRRDHAFASEAAGLLASLPNVRTHIFYSREDGRLSASRLAELEPPRGAEAYLCGPVPFMDEISAALVAIGLEASHVHTEPFGPAPGSTPGIAATPARPPHPPSGDPGSGPTIEFARSSLAVPWSDDYASLLEFAEACDVPVRWSCRTGVCHNCESGLVSGSVLYGPEPLDMPADGNLLVCCSQPTRDVVIDL